MEEELEPTRQAEDGVLSIPITTDIDTWGFSLRELMAWLRGFKGSKIEVPINSFGGEVFEGLAIYNVLLARPEEVTTKVIGYAMSMGSAILMAGKKRQMPKHGYIMLHNPLTMAFGDFNDYQAAADLLKKLTNSMAEIYAETTKMPVEAILEMMDRETWVNAEEALQMGFITEITQGAEIRASFSKQQLEAYKNIPMALLPDNKIFSMNFNEQLMGAINGLASKLEGLQASAGSATTPEETNVVADVPAEADDETDSDTNAGADDASTEALSALLVRLGESVEKLSQRVDKIAAAQTAANAVIAKMKASGSNLHGGNSGTPDASGTEAAFRKKAATLRPANAVDPTGGKK